MNTTDNMKSIIERQKTILKSLEDEVSGLEKSNLAQENERLNEEISKSQNELSEAKIKIEETSNELGRVKRALNVQLLQDKLTLLNSVNKSINDFYIGKSTTEENRLKAFESSCKNNVEKMYDSLAANGLSAEAEINSRIIELQGILDLKISELQRLKKEAEGSFLEEQNKKYKELRDESITK